MANKFFRLTQIASSAGRYPKHRATIDALGFRSVNDTVEVADTPQIRGMITMVHYLLKVEPVSGTIEKKANPMRALRRDLKKKIKKK